MKELDLSVFQKINKTQWLQLAQDPFEGADPMNRWYWESHELTKLSSYYDSSDILYLSYLKDFFDTVNPHQWKLYERIEVTNEKIANKKALSTLMSGCDGVIFDLKFVPNSDVLFEGIDTKYDVSLMNWDLYYPKGNFYEGTIPKLYLHFVPKIKEYNSPVSQLVDLIKTPIDQKIIYRLAFSDFFLEIATVRALTYLLKAEQNWTSIHIHTTICHHFTDEYQWFLNTTAGLATILGGSHSIDMPTAIGDSRVTRNVGNLIRDECGIAQYTNQCGGSYFVESLTDKIIQLVKEKMG